MNKKCKHCGIAAGYYLIIRYSGKGEYHFFDDGETEHIYAGKLGYSKQIDNGNFYDSASWREGKQKYCSNCRGKIGRIKL